MNKIQGIKVLENVYLLLKPAHKTSARHQRAQAAPWWGPLSPKHQAEEGAEEAPLQISDCNNLPALFSGSFLNILSFDETMYPDLRF